MNRRKIFFLAAMLLFCMLIVGGVLAQGTISIDRWVISGGGGPASGDGEIELNGALGQPIIGSANGSEGSISLDAGYYYAEKEYKIYIPLVLKNH